MTDMARTIESLLSKLTAPEKDALNFLVGLARMQLSVPRSYTVTLRQLTRDGTPPHDTVREVLAYSYDEAYKQTQFEMGKALPDGDPNLDRPWVAAITATIPKGTD